MRVGFLGLGKGSRVQLVGLGWLEPRVTTCGVGGSFLNLIIGVRRHGGHDGRKLGKGKGIQLKESIRTNGPSISIPCGKGIPSKESPRLRRTGATCAVPLGVAYAIWLCPWCVAACTSHLSCGSNVGNDIYMPN